MTEKEYFDNVVKELENSRTLKEPTDFDLRLYRATANWMKGPVLEHINKEKLDLVHKTIVSGWKSTVTGKVYDNQYANIDEAKQGKLPLPADEYPYTLEYIVNEPSFPIKSNHLRTLICYVEFTDLISFNIAKGQIFPEMIKNPEEHPWDIMERLGLIQNNDEGEIQKLALEVVAKFPEKAAEYKNGKIGLLGFFTGELIRAAGKGKINPKMANEILKNIL